MDQCGFAAPPVTLEGCARPDKGLNQSSLNHPQSQKRKAITNQMFGTPLYTLESPD